MVDGRYLIFFCPSRRKLFQTLSFKKFHKRAPHLYAETPNRHRQTQDGNTRFSSKYNLIRRREVLINNWHSFDDGDIGSAAAERVWTERYIYYYCNTVYKKLPEAAQKTAAVASLLTPTKNPTLYRKCLRRGKFFVCHSAARFRFPRTVEGGGAAREETRKTRTTTAHCRRVQSYPPADLTLRNSSWSPPSRSSDDAASCSVATEAAVATAESATTPLQQISLSSTTTALDIVVTIVTTAASTAARPRSPSSTRFNGGGCDATVLQKPKHILYEY